jgi:hypothetical protein
VLVERVGAFSRSMLLIVHFAYAWSAARPRRIAPITRTVPARTPI